MTTVRLLTRDRPLLMGFVPAIPLGLLVWWTVTHHTTWLYPVAIGGIAGGLIYLTVTWGTIPWTNAEETDTHAIAHRGPSRLLTEAFLLLACLLSIGGVLHLFAAGRASGSEKPIAAGVRLACITVAWATVHTVFSLRYAHLYYLNSAHPGEPPVDFSDEEPAYLDFFYMGLTVGMAYAVSDTTLRTRRFRGTAVLHALLSYVFGVVVLGSAVNLIVATGNPGS